MTSITATNPDTARSLTTMLKINKLHILIFQVNNVPADQIKCIAEGLKHNTTLLHLTLRLETYQ